MPIEKLRPEGADFDHTLRELEQLLPEAFADGRINWTVLRELLNDRLEDEELTEEHFGLFWPGKREARKLANKPSTGTLVPSPGEGADEAQTENLFIEGENLEVLKILRKSYAGRVKMIYIDPPYNTGNDFVYDDDFAEPLQDYLKRTGQIDGEGRPLTTNKKADGRFHSKWLSMIYPRLRLARELLREDGVIFVSIDDNEVHNLRMVMNEVFGEENFIDPIIWKKRYGGGAKEKYLVALHEYTLMYAKSLSHLENLFVPLTEDAIKRYYTHRDSNFSMRGPFRTHPLEAMKSFDRRANLNFPINAPDGSEVWPKRQWRWGKERVAMALERSEIHFEKGKNGDWYLSSKQYLKEEDGTIRKTKPFSVIDDIFTQHGTNEIINIFGNAKIFDFPKPSRLIVKYLTIGFNYQRDGIILDFFSGSATTAHAVLDLNREDGGNRKFILVQMPEVTDANSEAHKAGYKTIAEIGKERIRRVIKKLKAEDPEKCVGQDLGFKVFKLAQSHYKPWRNYHGEDIRKLEALFDEYRTPLVENWREQEDGLLTEILLLEGFPLSSQVEELSDYTRNRVRRISCTFHENRLLVCLDERISDETVAALELAPEEVFVCLDTAVDDETKSRLADKGLIKTI